MEADLHCIGQRLLCFGQLVHTYSASRFAPDVQAANRDTFYFPNIAPQHNTLNTKKEFWLGLEDYILDNTKLEGIRACVFNGPVFKNNDPVYRGLQIPLVGLVGYFTWDST